MKRLVESLISVTCSDSFTSEDKIQLVGSLIADCADVSSPALTDTDAGKQLYRYRPGLVRLIISARLRYCLLFAAA